MFMDTRKKKEERSSGNERDGVEERVTWARRGEVGET